MDFFEFIKSNPSIVETAKKCKNQNELHELIIENEIVLKDISENELYQLIKESQQQDEQMKDEILENVAGGMSNKTQRKLQDYAKEKSDPSVRSGNLGAGLTLDQCIDRCVKGDDFDNYYKDESDGLYYKLS